MIILFIWLHLSWTSKSKQKSVKSVWRSDKRLLGKLCLIFPIYSGNFFKFLPGSGYTSIKPNTTRMSNSFFLQGVRLLNILQKHDTKQTQSPHYIVCLYTLILRETMSLSCVFYGWNTKVKVKLTKQQTSSCTAVRGVVRCWSGDYQQPTESCVWCFTLWGAHVQLHGRSF